VGWVGDRLALLRLLWRVGPAAVVGLGMLMVASALLPAGTALVVGELTERVVAISRRDLALSAATPWLAALGVLLIADLLSQSLLVPVRDVAAMRVNGVIRQRVRRAMSAPSGIAHLGDQTVRSAAALPVFDRYLLNIGAAAEGQLWLLARFMGAFVSAGLLATLSVPVAAASFVLLATQRAILRRQYARQFGLGAMSITGASRAAAYWQQMLTSPAGAKEVRLFGFDTWAVGEFTRHHSELGRLRARLYSKTLRTQWYTFVLSGLAVGIPMVFLTRAALGGDIAPSRLAVGLSATLALTAIGAMGFEAFSIEVAIPQLAALRSLDDIVDIETPIPTGTVSDRTVPTILFEDVWFRYPGAQSDVLRGLTLEIKPGDSIAVVGANGAGKTTLVKLLAGFYVPDRGRITVDGIDLQDIDPPAWRRCLAVIFQDFVHFELNARDNIALGADEDRDFETDLQSSATAAGAVDLIEALPKGWDTMLSRAYAEGAELSGGQWQRIALARALFAARRGAGVLILDEPTANLDVHAETALFDQLLTHTSGKTAIVISHRFSTVRRARRIVVLDNGVVREDGSHTELLAANREYARLYRLQADRFSPDGNEPMGQPA
jgi:ATP-binding cassette subfamily B protein